MDPLSGAASVITVVALAVQVGESVYRLSKLLKSIRDAPKDLELLSNDLDRLRQILARVAVVAETQKGLPGLPAPSADLIPALKEVETRVKRLEDYASIVIANLRKKGVRKVLLPLKMPIHKDTLQKFRTEICQSREDLNTVLLLNSTQILIEQSKRIEKLLPPTSFRGQSVTSPIYEPKKQERIIHSSLSSYQNRRGDSKYAWYGTSKQVSYGTVLGLFGYCITYSESVFSERRKFGSKNAISLQAHNWSIIIFLWFINRYLELYSRAYRGQVERRWRFCPVDPSRLSPIWRLCEKGDTQGVLTMFNHGVSPYLKDEKGRSLLNAASVDSHTELCRLLIQLNVRLCAYDDESSDVPSRLYDITLDADDFQSSYDFMQMIIKHEEDLADGFTAAFDEYIMYFGDQGCIIWLPGENFKGRYWLLFPTDTLGILLAVAELFWNQFFEDNLCGVDKKALQYILRQMGPAEFSINHEKDLWLLNVLFRVDITHLHERNIWDLEATSEDLGRAFCSLLNECGINAQDFIDSMMDMNDGGDVYLEVLDFGTGEAGCRRLMRGEFTPLSLRWEWDPPPGENPYLMFEEFGQFYYENQLGSLNGNGIWGWPFTYEDDLCLTSEFAYITRQEKSLKRAQRKRKKDWRSRRIPGAFPG